MLIMLQGSRKLCKFNGTAKAEEQLAAIEWGDWLNNRGPAIGVHCGRPRHRVTGVIQCVRPILEIADNSPVQ